MLKYNWKSYQLKREKKDSIFCHFYLFYSWPKKNKNIHQLSNLLVSCMAVDINVKTTDWHLHFTEI